MKRNIKLLLLLTLVSSFLIISSCVHNVGKIEIPETELCSLSESGDHLICNDMRKEIPDYDRKMTQTDLCTNLEDYQLLEKFTIELIKKLQTEQVK